MPKTKRSPIHRYKAEVGLSYSELAKLWGLKPDYLRKLGSGLHPGKATALHIERASRGAIPAVDLVFGDY